MPSRLPIVASLTLAGLCGCAGDRVPVTVPREPQRIVAASVFATEVLLELVPRERLAGVHFLAADPRYSPVADRVSGLTLVGAEPEELLAARPDLVVVDAYTRAETLALLDAAGVALLRPPEARSFGDIWANVRLLGKACASESAAEALVASAERRLAAVAAGAGERRAWRLLSLDGALHTLGEGSLFDAIVRAAGAHNAARDDGVRSFRRLDVETVLALPVDAIVLSGDPAQPQAARGWLDQHPGLRLLPAVQGDRLLLVPGPLLASTSHRLVGAVEAVARQLDAWGRP